MTNEIILKWNDEMNFSSVIDGHKISVDAAADFGGQNKGPRPKALLMLSLAGCTAMDVVSLCKKMRVEFDSFNIRVQGNIAEEHPKKYESIKLIYEFSGNNIDLEKVDKAIKMSEEKYCGVWASLKPAIKIYYEISII